MGEGQAIDYTGDLPEFQGLRNALRAYRDEHREYDAMHFDKFLTDMIQIIQEVVPTLSLEEALSDMKEAVFTATNISNPSESQKKDIAWGALGNLVDDLERKARE